MSVEIDRYDEQPDMVAVMGHDGAIVALVPPHRIDVLQSVLDVSQLQRPNDSTVYVGGRLAKNLRQANVKTRLR